jgi:hypothetical protein
VATYDRVQELYCLIKTRLQYLQKVHPLLETLRLLP